MTPARARLVKNTPAQASAIPPDPFETTMVPDVIKALKIIPAVDWKRTAAKREAPKAAKERTKNNLPNLVWTLVEDLNPRKHESIMREPCNATAMIGGSGEIAP